MEHTFIFQIYDLTCLPQILNESIPHIVASLLTHMIATAWAAFQLVQTADFKADFNRLSTNGACNKVNFLPQYWKQRNDAEISSLAFNVAALLTSAFLTWRLMKVCLSFGMHWVMLRPTHSYLDGKPSNALAPP